MAQELAPQLQELLPGYLVGSGLSSWIEDPRWQIDVTDARGSRVATIAFEARAIHLTFAGSLGWLKAYDYADPAALDGLVKSLLELIAWWNPPARPSV